MINVIPSDNSNLRRILSDIFPNKKIMIQDNNDGSQTIFLLITLGIFSDSLNCNLTSK